MSNRVDTIFNNALKRIRLGDKIETIANVTGIASVVKLVEKKTGKPCGCKQRKKRLNGADQSSVEPPPKKIPDSAKDIHEDDGTNEGMDEPIIKLNF